MNIVPDACVDYHAYTTRSEVLLLLLGGSLSVIFEIPTIIKKQLSLQLKHT